MRRPIVPALAILAAFAAPAMAQESGGIALAPHIARGPTGLARPMPFVLPGITASDVQASLKATDRSTRHQAMIARLRGNAGYLGGFAFGAPLAASVQPMPQIPLAPDPGFGPSDGSGYGSDWHGPSGGRGSRQIVVNQVDVTTFQGPVVVGNNNSVQQQIASGSGPIALQQVMGQPGASGTGGAVNAIGPNGNVIQRAPGAARPHPARVPGLR
jgi:hypothetical protein